MANIGLVYPVAALLTEGSSGPSYNGGFVVGKAVSASMSIDFVEATLYADNTVAERVKEFKSGKLTFNSDDLTHEVQSKLLKRTLSSTGSSSATNMLTAKTDDTPPYVGFGFYGTVLRNNVRLARAIWLYKCQFSPPNVDFSTRGDNIDFKTPTIEGVVMALGDGRYMDDAIFQTETEARAWLNAQAEIEAE